MGTTKRPRIHYYYWTPRLVPDFWRFSSHVTWNARHMRTPTSKTTHENTHSLLYHCCCVCKSSLLSVGTNGHKKQNGVSYPIRLALFPPSQDLLALHRVYCSTSVLLRLEQWRHRKTVSAPFRSRAPIVAQYLTSNSTKSWANTALKHESAETRAPVWH